MQAFSEWILGIGDGKISEPNDKECIIELPNDTIIWDSKNPLGAITNSTYPNLLENIHDLQFFQERAILAPTLEIVDKVNQHMLDLLLGEERCFFELW